MGIIGFKKYIRESAVDDTDFYESSACLGSIMNKSLYKLMTSYVNGEIPANKVKPEIVKAISSDYDWNKKGIKLIKSVKVGDDVGMNDVCKLAIGMYKFVDEFVKPTTGIKKVYFIHNKIEDYYKVEREVMGALEGSKKNTADCVLSNLKPDELLAAMKKDKPESSKNGRFVIIGKKGICVPVSLKKAPAGAQLGKITTFLRKNLNLGIDTEDAISTLTSSVELPTFKQALDEGIFDNLKGILTSVFNKLKDFVSSVVSKVSKKYIKIFQSKPSEQHIMSFVNDMEIVEEIKESILNEKTGKRDEQLAKEISKDPDKAIKLINREIKKLNKKSDSTPLIYQKTNLVKSIGKLKSDKKLQESFFILANYLTVKTLQDLVEEDKKLSSTVNRLNAEMLFGGTKLPLWKVYGDYGQSHDYEFLGTIETFSKRKIRKKVEILGYRINPVKQHYSIMVYILNELTDDGNKIYSILRTGTNSSSHISFIFEGTQLSKPIPLKTSISDFV